MIAKCLWVLFVSMVPIIELRGGIPVGLGLGLGYPLSITLAVIGNLIPIPFLIIYGRRVLEYFAKFEKFGIPFRWILRLGEKKVAQMKKNPFLGALDIRCHPPSGDGGVDGGVNRHHP